jgi:hypothetical protein
MEQKQRFINLAQSGRFTVSELSEEFGITRKMIFPRKRVEGLTKERDPKWKKHKAGIEGVRN